MKAYILSENIQKKLPFLSHAISTKSQLPILLNFLLEAKTGGLSISATDLEIGIQIELPAHVEEEGATTVPAKQFLELISALPAEKILLEGNATSLSVKTEKTKNQFQTMAKEEYPMLYEEKGLLLAVLAKDIFHSEVTKVLFAASVDSGRPALSGIYMQRQSEGFLLVATDGYRLSLKQYKGVLEQKSEDEKPLLIPARVFKEASSMKEEGKTINIYVSKEKNQVLFEEESTILVGRLIDAQFPQYEKIIPTDHATTVAFDRQEMQKAVKICSIFAREAANIIKFAIKQDKIIVSANASSVGENSVEVDAKVTGEENEIAFNGRYLLDFLTNVEENDLIFEMTGPLNPGVFKIQGDSTYLHLIMPIRVQA